jgi:uncharacterized cupin superfamily protein
LIDVQEEKSLIMRCFINNSKPMIRVMRKMDQAKEDNIAYVNNDLVTGRKTMTRTT